MNTRHFLRLGLGLSLALGLTGLAGGAAAQALTPDEAQLVARVRQHTPAALQLLERSVLINSGTLNPAGVREVGALFAQEFEALGFKTRWVDMPAEMRRAGHLVAERTGDQGQRVLLIDGDLRRPRLHRTCP